MGVCFTRFFITSYLAAKELLAKPHDGSMSPLCSAGTALRDLLAGTLVAEPQQLLSPDFSPRIEQKAAFSGINICTSNCLGPEGRRLSL